MKVLLVLVMVLLLFVAIGGFASCINARMKVEDRYCGLAVGSVCVCLILISMKVWCML